MDIPLSALIEKRMKEMGINNSGQPRDFWRYLFAGLAMNGLTQVDLDTPTDKVIALLAVEFADALLAELEKEKE